jgi:hypothetical protein
MYNIMINERRRKKHIRHVHSHGFIPNLETGDALNM